MPLDVEICEAWRQAAVELGIRVIAPFRIELPDGAIDVEVYLPDFGGPRGAIAVSLYDGERARRASVEAFFVSLLSDSYRHFSDGYFETLWTIGVGSDLRRHVPAGTPVDDGVKTRHQRLEQPRRL